MTPDNHPFFELLKKENFPEALRSIEVEKVLRRYGAVENVYVVSSYTGNTDTERLINCLTDCVAGGTVLIDRDMTFENTSSNEIHITTEGITVDGMGHKVTFTEFLYSAFQVRADNVTIKNLEIFCSEPAFDITPISSGYENLPARQRSAGVFVYDCNKTKVENVTVDGFVCGVNISGVRDKPTTFYTDHNILNLTANNVEQGILATQCDRLVIEGMNTVITTRVQENGSGDPIEPHSIYMTNTTGTDVGTTNITSKKVTVRNCNFYHNHFDSFMKFKYCSELKVSDVHCSDGEIVLQVEECDNARVSDVTASQVQTYVANTQQAFHILESENVTLTNCHVVCEEDEQEILFRVNTGSNGARFINCGGVQDRLDGTGNAVFLVVSDYCEIVNCYFTDIANIDLDYLVDCSGDYLTVKYPRVRGTSLIGVLRDTNKNSELTVLDKDVIPTFDSSAQGPAGSVMGWRTIDTGGGFNKYTIT